MTIKDMRVVLEAAEENKAIQRRRHSTTKWEDCFVDEDRSWNFDEWEFRVKPEPRDWWTNEYALSLGSLHTSREKALESDPDNHRIACIHVREVIE